jgi:hypothetical protein
LERNDVKKQVRERIPGSNRYLYKGTGGFMSNIILKNVVEGGAL